MQVEDLKAGLEKLINDAAECDVTASLAIEDDKRRKFRSLAAQHRVADKLRKTLANREAV